jgi:hypothetical protein
MVLFLAYTRLRWGVEALRVHRLSTSCAAEP